MGASMKGSLMRRENDIEAPGAGERVTHPNQLFCAKGPCAEGERSVTHSQPAHLLYYISDESPSPLPLIRVPSDSSQFRLAGDGAGVTVGETC